MKYLDTLVGFREFPDEISLCINISGCQFRCPDCHSKYLWEDKGTELTCEELHNLINRNQGITLIGFMGGNLKEIIPLIEYIKNINPSLKIGWYTGKILKNDEILNLCGLFNYIKSGPFIKELGGLDKPSTNQKFYHLHKTEFKKSFEDITYKFWLNE